MAYKVVERRAALLCPVCGKPLTGVFKDFGGSVVAMVACGHCTYVQPVGSIRISPLPDKPGLTVDYSTLL